MRVLVVNAGSTTVKLAVLDADQPLYSSTIEGHEPVAAVDSGLAELRQNGLLPVAAVGHRFVHGGSAFTSSVLINGDVITRLTALNDLAPLHNPPALAALVETHRQLHDVPHIAVFDTAFHATMPPIASTYPVPEQWTRDWGIRKFGFHGLSHAYCSARAAEMLGRQGDPTLRLIIAHLGGGCSLSAVRGGVSIETTMGFTPLDGLMMATRCGSVDPGVLLHVLRTHGLSPDDIDRALNKESGLLGVSGLSADMREVQRAAASGDPRAALALDLFRYRVRLGIGGLAAALNGIDALIFTAGIGENDRQLRAAVCGHLGFLGINLDPGLNSTAKPDAEISTPDSRCRVLVIHTREDVTITREVQRVLSVAR